MEILSLVIAVLALMIASAACYRSDSKKRIRSLERALNEKIEQLSRMTQRAADNVAVAAKAAYERNLRMISDLQSRVAALREKAIEEIREDLRMIAQTLDRLAERAGGEVKEVKSGVNLAWAETEEMLRITVEETKAWLKMIEAKRELVLARIALFRNNLDDAESRVESALSYVNEARSLTVDHVEGVTALQNQAQEMLVAIGTKADSMRATLDVLIERINRLLKEMSGREAEAKSAA